MGRGIIKPKGDLQFHHMGPVVLFSCSVLAYLSGNYLVLVVLLLIAVAIFVMVKNLQIDTIIPKVKNDLFSAWDDLSTGDYIFF